MCTTCWCLAWRNVMLILSMLEALGHDISFASEERFLATHNVAIFYFNKCSSLRPTGVLTSEFPLLLRNVYPQVNAVMSLFCKFASLSSIPFEEFWGLKVVLLLRKVCKSNGVIPVLGWGCPSLWWHHASAGVMSWGRPRCKSVLSLHQQKCQFEFHAISGSEILASPNAFLAARQNSYCMLVHGCQVGFDAISGFVFACSKSMLNCKPDIASLYMCAWLGLMQLLALHSSWYSGMLGSKPTNAAVASTGVPRSLSFSFWV